MILLPEGIGGSRVILPNPMKVSGLMVDFIAYLEQEKEPVQKALMGLNLYSFTRL